MCNKRGAFVGDKNISVIKMHGETIKKMGLFVKNEI